MWIPLAFSISHFVCNPSCYFIICKRYQSKCFLRERCDLTSPRPVHGPPGGDGQPAAGQSAACWPSSCVGDEHRPKHLIKRGNIQTKEACSLSHRLHPEMNIPEQHTF